MLIMSLVFQPNADGSPDDYFVLHGGLHVGQIYKRAVTFRPAAQWLWALNGVPEGPKGLIFTGQTATLDEAKAAIEERWDEWLEWADLSEAGGANVSEFRG
jgi:hypothetical protein